MQSEWVELVRIVSPSFPKTPTVVVKQIFLGHRAPNRERRLPGDTQRRHHRRWFPLRSLPSKRSPSRELLVSHFQHGMHGIRSAVNSIPHLTTTRFCRPGCKPKNIWYLLNSERRLTISQG